MNASQRNIDRYRVQSASDVDVELTSFFSGEYAGQMGLRSATGAALERAALQMGSSSTSMPDGWDDNVRFNPDAQGRHSYHQASLVIKSLRMVAGPEPLKKKAKKDERFDAVEWPFYFPVLKGYYTRRPWGAHDGLMGKFGEFIGAILICPMTIDLVSEWCAVHEKADMAANAIAIAKSREEAAKRLEDLKVEAARPRSPLGQWQVQKRLAAASQPIAEVDTEHAIRLRWRPGIEEHTVGMLRDLVARATTGKEGARKQAGRQIDLLLDEARTLRWNAKEAYVVARRSVETELRLHTRMRQEQGARTRLADEVQSIRQMIFDDVNDLG